MKNLRNGSTAEKCCQRMGWIGMLVTLGIVFGDIGTSPLYVMKAILHVGQRVDEPMIGENGAFPPTRNGCIHSLSMRERG